MSDIWGEIPNGLDASTLRTLARDTNLSILGELLASFVTEMSQQVEAIAMASKGGDLDTLSGICHTMKGLSATFGATTLAEMMQQIEMALHQGQSDKITEIVADVERESKDTKECILQVVALIKEPNEQ